MDNQQEKVFDVMSYCVGVMLGDGHCSMNLDGYPNVQLEMMDEEVVVLFADAIAKQFNFSPNVIKRTRGGTDLWRVSTRRTNVYEFFRDITHFKQFFPEWYFTANEWEQKSLLAGLWDTDGYVTESHHDKYTQLRVGFSNTNYRLVCDTARLLTMLKVRVARIEEIEVQGNRLPQWRIFPNTKDFQAITLPLQCKRKLDRLYRTSENSNAAT